MELLLVFDEVAPTLNGDKGLKRMHHQVYKKLRERWEWLVASKTREKVKGKVNITYTRASVTAPDWDNLASSFKPIGDALVNNGVIEDDNPTVVINFIPRWEKAKNNKSLYTYILIQSIP